MTVLHRFRTKQLLVGERNLQELELSMLTLEYPVMLELLAIYTIGMRQQALLQVVDHQLKTSALQAGMFLPIQIGIN